MQNELKAQPLRAVVAAVQLPSVSDIELEASVTELRELAKTLGYQVVGTFIQKRAKFDSTAYMGLGKRQEMRDFVEGIVETGNAEESELEDEQDADLALASERRIAKGDAARAKEAARSAADPETRHVDIILVDHEISPSQARNLEIEVG